MAEDEKNQVDRQEEDEGSHGGPQIYNVKKDLAGWSFNRRRFLTAATAVAAGTATAVVAGGTANKATAQPIQVFDDQSELEGVELKPGKPFTKVWRFRNNTNVDWGEEAELHLIGSERLQAPASVPIPNAAPGETVSVEVNMLVPARPGDYQIKAILQITDTLAYTMYLPIVFKKFVTPTPTHTPTPTSTSTPTNTPTPTNTATPTDTPTATPCSCHSHCSCDGHCTCDPYCTCDTVHYWHPN